MKQTEKLNTQPKSSHEIKRQMRWRAKWGFALSRLRKHPLSRYCQTALLSNFNSRKGVFFFAQTSPFLVGIIIGRQGTVPCLHKIIKKAPATLREGSLRELFLPSLVLASRQRLSSEMRTQSKMQGILEMSSMTLGVKKTRPRRWSSLFWHPQRESNP